MRNRINIVPLFLVFCLMPFSCLMAGEAQYQDINYTFDENHMTAEVALNPRATGEIFIPEQIQVGQNSYTVVGISDKAFKGCKNLTAIVLPKTLKQVYRSAFEGTGILLNKSNWTEGCLWIDSVLIATDKNIKPRFAVCASKGSRSSFRSSSITAAERMLQTATMITAPANCTIELPASAASSVRGVRSAPSTVSSLPFI